MGNIAKCLVKIKQLGVVTTMSCKVLYSQRQLGEGAGISQQMVSYILKGDRQPSIEIASKLENATGICREAWLWPERHFNPYIPFSDVMVCVTCKNVIGRVKAANKIFLRIFRETKDFDLLVEAARVYHGIRNEEIDFRYREVRPDGFHILSTPAKTRNCEPVLTVEHLGPNYELLLEQGYLALTWYPPLEQGVPQGRPIPYNLTLHSGLMVIGPKRRLVWSVSNYVSEMAFTQEMIQEMIEWTAQMEEIWIADQH